MLSRIIGLVFFVTIAVIVSYWERRKFGTIITPFGLVVWPYITIVAMINMGGVYFGFFPVSVKSTLFVMLCSFFVLLGGLFSIRIFGDKNKQGLLFKRCDNDLALSLDFYRPLVAVVTVSIFAGVLQFYLCIQEFGLLSIPTAEFRKAYWSGALAHVMFLSRLGFVFYFVDYFLNGKKSNILILLLILLLIIVSQSKYQIFVLLLCSLYICYFNNLISISLKKMLMYCVIIYFFFNLSYVVGFGVLGIDYAYSKSVQAFLFTNFFTYLFGGPIGFSVIFEKGVYPLFSYKEIFAVPVNVYKFLIGDPNMVSIIISDFVSVSNIYEYMHYSNVYGLFGMLYAYSGVMLTVIHSFIIGFIAYAVGLFALRKTSMFGAQMQYSLIMGFLTLSFFGYYFNMLTFVEISFYMLVVPYCYYIIKNKRVLMNRPSQVVLVQRKYN